LAVKLHNPLLLSGIETEDKKVKQHCLNHRFSICLILSQSVLKYFGSAIFNAKFLGRFLQSWALLYPIVPGRFVWKQLIFYSSFVSQGFKLFYLLPLYGFHTSKIRHWI